jgi:hypothetical protein
VGIRAQSDDDAQSPEPHRHRRSRRAPIPGDVLRVAGEQESYTGEAVPDAGNAGFCVFDDNGLVLTLMKGRDDLKYPATFHIGFMQESEQKVNELSDRLRRDGYDADALSPIARVDLLRSRAGRLYD